MHQSQKLRHRNLPASLIIVGLLILWYLFRFTNILSQCLQICYQSQRWDQRNQFVLENPKLKQRRYWKHVKEESEDRHYMLRLVII